MHSSSGTMWAGWRDPGWPAPDVTSAVLRVRFPQVPVPAAVPFAPADVPDAPVAADGDSGGPYLRETAGAACALRRAVVRLANLLLALARDELGTGGEQLRSLHSFANSREPAEGEGAELLRWLAPDEVRLLAAAAADATPARAAGVFAVAQWLSSLLAAAVRCGAVDEDVAAEMERASGALVDALHDALSARRVPVPFAYVQMMNLGLLFLFLVLPFAMVHHYRWMMIPLCVLTGVAFFGVNCTAGEVSDPFGPDPNDLPLDAYISRLHSSTACTLLQRDLNLCPGGVEELLNLLRGAEGTPSPAPPFWDVARALDPAHPQRAGGVPRQCARCGDGAAGGWLLCRYCAASQHQHGRHRGEKA